MCCSFWGMLCGSRGLFGGKRFGRCVIIGCVAVGGLTKNVAWLAARWVFGVVLYSWRRGTWLAVVASEGEFLA